MNAATHPVDPEEVMAFLDGEISLEQGGIMAAHIESCARCSATAADFRGLSSRLSQWQIMQFPRSLGEAGAAPQLEAAARGKPGLLNPLSGRPSSPLRWVVIGCSAVGALLLLIWVATPNLHRSKMTVIEAREYHQGNASHLGQRSGDSLAELDLPPAGSEAGRGSLGKMQVPEKDNQEVLGESNGVKNGPLIARTVLLSVVVKDFEAGRASLDAVLSRHKGYAASLNVSTPMGAARRLEASLRIPAPQLEAALRELKSPGRVEGESQNGEEVTEQHSDLVARIKNDRETEVRLQDILRTRTGKVKDVLDVEQEIARVRGEIEQMEAEQKNLEHRVDFAAIDLKLAEEYKAQLRTPAPSALIQVRNAGINGFRNLFGSVLALVLFLAESGPSLLFWLTLLGIPAWRLWRRYRRTLSLGSFAGA